jgi:integrase/recombinase XerD
MQRDPQLSVERLWTWSRTTMAAGQGSDGGSRDLRHAAMPRGLRHSFGVSAFQSNVPPHRVQRRLGHASLRTTSIYGDVMGPEERAFAERMWK